MKIKMKTVRIVTALVALSITLPASAALFVSGDVNILGSKLVNISNLPANQRFIKNIAGTNVLIQHSSGIFDNTVEANNVAKYLTTQSIVNTVLTSGAQLTSQDFEGRTLFIGLGSDDAYSANEMLLMHSFLNSGGSILLTGDNEIFFKNNGYINEALTGLNSSMRIVTDSIDTNYHTANVLTANPFTAGTTGLQYGSTSRVTGGNGLYSTATGNQTFVAFERSVAAAVPEPTTWAMGVIGFGVVGASLRRRPQQLSLV